jgi:hypothetical protein
MYSKIAVLAAALVQKRCLWSSSVFKLATKLLEMALSRS